MADGRVKVGIIGSQFQADIHAAPFQIMPQEAEVVAIASPTPGNAAALAKRFGIPRVFTDYREMLKERDIEMVCICAPNSRQAYRLRKTSGHDHCRRRRDDRQRETPRRLADVWRRAFLHAKIFESQGNGGCRRVWQNSSRQAKRKAFRAA